MNHEAAPVVFEGDVPMDRLAHLLACQLQFSAAAARLGEIAWYQERAGVETCSLQQAADLRVLTVAHCLRVRPFDEHLELNPKPGPVQAGMSREREELPDEALRAMALKSIEITAGNLRRRQTLFTVAAEEEAAELDRADRYTHPFFPFCLGAAAMLGLLLLLAVIF